MRTRQIESGTMSDNAYELQGRNDELEISVRGVSYYLTEGERGLQIFSRNKLAVEPENVYCVEVRPRQEE